MVHGGESTPKLVFLVKLLEPELEAEDLAAEIQYLYEDLADLNHSQEGRLRYLEEVNGDGPFQRARRVGVRFEVPADRLRAVLRRLCDRLDDQPLETLVLIQQGQTKLQIQTHQAEALAGILPAAEALLPPDQIYLAKAETYSRTLGEISPAEDAVLDVLRQRLDLSKTEAELLKAKAMGPYKTLEAKRKRFHDVLVVELARQCPLAEDTWAVLQELADNLGLPRKEAAAVYQTQLQQMRVETEAIRQRQEAEAEAARQRELDAQRRAEADQQRQSRHHYLDQYRTMVRQALQTTLYPLTFDQGRLEQARQMWEISATDASQIEETIRSELYGSIESEMAINYSRLRQLLWEQAWQAADEETENVMFRATQRQNMEPLDRDAVLQVPCSELRIIDQLWQRYSNGKFGFTPQQQIFLQLDRRPLDFLQHIEWRDGTVSLNRGLKPYSSLQFSIGAPVGHLPTWRWCCSSLEGGYEVGDAIVEAMFLHLDKCFPAASTPVLDHIPPIEGA